MDEIVKVCKIHGELKKDKVYSKKNKNGKTYFECKSCALKTCKIYANKFKEKISLHKKKYNLENKEKIKKWINLNRGKVYEIKKRWRIKNREKYIKSWKEKNKRSVENMDDCYLRKLISDKSSLKHEDIPIELVEAKRDLLKFKRLIKEKYGGNK